MIDDKELQSLVSFGGDGKVLSVYLDTDLSDKSKEAVKLMFSGRAKDLGDAAATEVRAVQKFLDFEYDWLPRGLALFASGDALWKVIPLAIPVRTQAYYADRPYVRVLTDVLDRFGKYGAVLIDKEGVRLFSVAWGKIQSETESFGEELKRHKQGGWAAARYQRHEDNLALHNVKQAIEVLQSFCQSTGHKRFMLGGSSEVLSLVRELLPKQMRERVIGEFVVDMEASPNEILNRTLDIAARVDLEEERKMVSRAITAAAKGGQGVIGLADTVHVLHQGRARLLLVEESYEIPGHVCGHCGYVSAEGSEKCPFCGREEMKETPDVVNLAIHKAIETGAQVNIVRENPELSAAGGIAAILRY